MSRLGTLTARVVLDTTGLSASSTLVRSTFAGLGIAAVGLSAAIYKIGAGYEQSLNTFQSVSRASADEMQMVAAEAKKLGADMELPATSAADAALAMTELAKAGLSVTESMDAAKGVLQLAAAAQVDEARAAEITANALNAFGLEATEAGRVADILAASANASSAEITDMADALQMSSAVFAAAHIPLEDLAAAVGELANKGIKGSDAGTSMKQMLLSLEGPSKKAKGVMDELGISIYDETGSMKSLRDIIGNVSAAMGPLTEEQRNQALATIFGSDAVRAANIVLLGGVDAFDQMKEAVTREGAAAEVAAAKSKGLKGAIDGLKSQFETIAISIYEKVAPALERFVRLMADNIQPTLIAVATVVTAIVVPAFWAWASAQAAVHGPALAVAAAVAGIAAAAIYAYQHFEGFRTVVDAVASFLVNTAWPAIQSFAGFVATEFGHLVRWVRTHWGSIQEAVGHVIAVISLYVEGWVTTVTTLWRLWGDEILAVARAVWNQVQNIVETAVDILAGIIEFALAVINGDWKEAGDALNRIVSAAFEFLVESIRNGVQVALEIVKAIPGEILGALGDLGGILYDAGWSIISGLWDGMRDRVVGMFNWVASLGSKIASLKGPLEYDRHLLTPAGEAIIAGLVAGMKNEEARLVSHLARVTGLIQGPYGAPQIMPAGLAMPGATGGSGWASSSSTTHSTSNNTQNIHINPGDGVTADHLIAALNWKLGVQGVMA